MNERTRSLGLPAAARPSLGDRAISRTPYRGLTLTIWALLVCVALTLLVIGARSPYTHSNLSAGYDESYDRTSQIVIGRPSEFDGVSVNTAVGTDPADRGGSLYVTAGCATCHGLEGRGAPVGPPIAGMDAETTSRRIREGPAGMPKFSVRGLTDLQVADIAAYLMTLEATK